MGTFDTDTRVTHTSGNTIGSAQLSPQWEIWGPNGGYLAAIALRALEGIHPDFTPASVYCQYLNVANFGPISVCVRHTKGGKDVLFFNVDLVQEDKLILTALIILSRDCPGFQHDLVKRPKGWCQKENAIEDNGKASGHHAFWRNFDIKLSPTAVDDFTGAKHTPNNNCAWYRFQSEIDLSQPFLDAARSLVLIDTLQWPAVYHQYASERIRFIAPSLDLHVQFHRSASTSPWLFCDTEANVAGRGLIAGMGSVWSEQGELIASGASHLLCRPIK